MTTMLRVVAVLIAAAGVLDPAFAINRPRPAAVDIRAGSDRDAEAIAGTVRQHLRHHARARSASDRPAAVVLVAPSSGDLDRIRPGVPVSVVQPDRRTGVRITSVAPVATVLPGQAAVVNVELEAADGFDATMVVALEQHGVELARVSVPWLDRSRRQRISLSHVPAAPGVHDLRVVVRDGDGSGSQAVDGADVAVVAEARTLRVTTYEPRLSWSAAFVRRALEDDPAFAASAFAQPSRGIEVRAGDPPRRLTAAALEPFDAVVVGAPESLSSREVDALETFVRIRGGAVVLVPDRRPSGAYLRLMPSAGFEEVLVDAPLTLEGPAHQIKATELAIPRDPGAAAVVLASVRLQAQPRPVIVSWPMGAGRIVFSGALDAWRFRGEPDAAFTAFWQGLAANVALSAPRPLSVAAEPARVAPGDRVTVRAALRRTEWESGSQQTQIPAVGVSLVSEDGSQRAVRVWPTAEAGVFEGTLVAERAGRFHLRASAGALAADTPVVVSPGLRIPPTTMDDRLEFLARASGGVVVSAGSLDRLDAHLAALEPRDEAVTIRPMRSAWWMLAFAGALCAEWALRRRKGLR